MLALASTTDKINVVTTSTANTDVQASYADYAAGTVTLGRKNTAIASAATTDITGSPTASTQRNIKHLSIRNKHAFTSQTVTLQHVDGGGSTVELYSCVLLAGGQMVYSGEMGFRVYGPTGGQTSNGSVPTARILGRISAGTGSVEYLTATQARTVLGLATTDVPTFKGVKSASTATNDLPVVLSGMSQGGETDTEGVYIRLGYNATGNRQLWIGDSAGAGLSTRWSFRYLVGSTYEVPYIDSIRNDGVVGGGVLLCGTGSGSNVGIGFAPSLTTQASLLAKLHVESTGGQLRLSYDASNYWSTLISSAGLATFNFAGSGRGLILTMAGTTVGRLYASGGLFLGGTPVDPGAGNIGLSALPSTALDTNYAALLIGNSGLVANSTIGSGKVVHLVSNGILAASAIWKYVSTDTACLYTQQAGTHYFFNAASGTSGNNITFGAASWQITSASLIANFPIALKQYTVATLPTGSNGFTAFVSDASGPTFGATVVGGGAVKVPVYHDGTNWKVG